MLRIVTVGALASLVSLACGQQPFSVCGQYEGNCLPFGGSKFKVDSSINFDAISQGAASHTLQYYAEGTTTCNSSDNFLQVLATGAYVDLGPRVTGEINQRNMSFMWDAWAVTPQTPEAVTSLTSACPCGKSWTLNVQRELTDCPSGTCKDTSFLGGTEVNDTSSIVMDGLPVYASILIDQTAGSGSVTLSQQFSNAADGFDASITTDVITMPITATGACGVVSATSDFCGGWIGACIPTVISGAMKGLMEEFNYYGPTTDSSMTSGVYNRTRKIYDDTNCKPGTEYLSFVEEGTMAFPAASTVYPGARTATRHPLFVDVTPQSTQAVEELNGFCGCGQGKVSWTQSVPRRMTTCPLTSCTPFDWYDGLSFGRVAYGAAVVVAMAPIPPATDGRTEIRFSKMFPDESSGNAASPADGPFAIPGTSACADSDTSLDYCGLYEMGCSVSESIGSDDRVTWVFGGGIGTNNADYRDGMVEMSLQRYTAGGSCADASEDLNVTAIGYYSLQGNATITGGSHVLIKFRELRVLPMNQDIVDILNGEDSCPCGGTWSIGKARTLITCPTDSCNLGSKYFTGSTAGALGTPGFGSIVLDGNSIRMTDLLANQDAGYAEPFGPGRVPLKKAVTVCAKEQPYYTYCGDWTQPCQEAGIVDRVMTFNASDKDFTYVLEQIDYTSGTGCRGGANGLQSTEQLYVKQTGTFKIGKNTSSTVATVGSNIELQPDEITIMPITDAATDDLNSECACGSKWFTGTSRKFDGASPGCNPGECTSVLYGKQVIGGPAYGNIMRIGFEFRLSALSADDSGYNNGATINDFGFVLDDEDYCVHKTPIPGPSTSSGGMTGGDVFLLIFFLFATVYFGGGMIMNYRSTGSPTVPHVDFWRTLPSLISDGCGTSAAKVKSVTGIGGGGGKSGHYQDFGSSNAGGYGAL